MRPLSDKPYRIVFVSVDGGGGHPEQFALRRDAVAAANAMQERADLNGNPWTHSFHVYHERGGPSVYSTHPIEQ